MNQHIPVAAEGGHGGARVSRARLGVSPSRRAEISGVTTPELRADTSAGQSTRDACSTFSRCARTARPAAIATRFASSLVALALIATAFAQSPTPPNTSGLPTDFLDDDAIVAHVETEGGALIRAGKTEKIKLLRAALLKAGNCALTLPMPETKPLTGEELFARRASGVVVLGVLARVKKKGKYELSGCTGFALAAGGIIVTNYHVIDSPEAEALVVMTRDGTVAPVTEVLAADKLADVAIIRAPGVSPLPLPLAVEKPLPGATVWAISHPDHNFFSLTAGIVSRHFIATTDFGKTPQMAVTADFGAGSSGGPIFDREGSVTGMVCSTTSVYWEDAKGKVKDLQMVFKHCVPAASIRHLITSAAP